MSIEVKKSMPQVYRKVTEWTDDMRKWPNVMYGDIYNYLIGSKAVDGQEMKNYKSLQSYNYFQSGNVDKIVHQTSGGKIIMKADVRSSQTVSRVNEAFITCCMDGQIEMAWCTCMAGQGLSCSHIGAILWKIEHAVRNNLTGVSCTDEIAKWNRGTKRNIEPKPLANISFKKPKVNHDIFDEDGNDPGTRETPMYETVEEFRDSVINSELVPLFNIKGTTLNKSFLSSPEPRINVPHTHGNHDDIRSCGKCTMFYDIYVSLSSPQIEKLKKETVTQSNSILWRDSRKLRITASTAHKVPVKETTSSENFIREHIHPKFVGNKFTKHGQECEVVAKQYLVAEGFSLSEQGLFVSLEENWLSASPDGILNGDTVLEVKSPVPTMAWSTLDELFSSGKYDVAKENDNLVLKVKGNRGFYMQVQLTMFCTGLRKCKLLIWLNENDHSFLDVEYDENYVTSHVTRLRTFYAKKMLSCLVDEIEEDRLMLSKSFKKFMHL